MNPILPVFLLSTILLASADPADHFHADQGEYGYYTTWRKAVCEKNSQDLYKEMDVCFRQEQKVVIDASEECAKEVHPDSNGDITSFINAACEDKQLFIKFDTCFEEYEANANFRKMMEISPEIEECYGEVLEKYALDNLREYLKEFVQQ